MGVYNAKGNLVYTLVDGNTAGGIYAADGNFRAFDATATGPGPLLHVSGAYRVFIQTVTAAYPYYAPNGAINCYNNNDGAVSPVVPLHPLPPLDGLPTAFAAWSMARKLRSAYTGQCIRVRESGGNTQADIGFVGNLLDTTALATLCGSNSGFIVTRYDQSGNGLDETMATTASQPRIWNAGVLDASPNGRPWAVYDGTNDGLTRPSVAYPAQDFSAVSVALIETSINQLAYPRLLAVGPASGTVGIGACIVAPLDAAVGTQNGDALLWGQGYNAAQAAHAVVQVPGFFDGAIHQHDIRIAAGGMHWRLDGTPKTLRSSLAGTPTSLAGNPADMLSVASQGGTTSFAAMREAEEILWATDLSNAQRAIILADQKAFYGTP